MRKNVSHETYKQSLIFRTFFLSPAFYPHSRRTLATLVAAHTTRHNPTQSPPSRSAAFFVTTPAPRATTFPSVCTPQAQHGATKHSRSSTTTAPPYSLKSVAFLRVSRETSVFLTSRQPHICYTGLRIRGVFCFVVMLYHSKHARLPISFLTALPSKNSRRQRRRMSAQANAVASQPCTPTLGIMLIYIEKSPAFSVLTNFCRIFHLLTALARFSPSCSSATSMKNRA